MPTTNIETPPTIEEQVTAETAAQSNDSAPEAKPGWIEEIEVAGSQLVERVKELVSEGNVRRLIVRMPDDRVLLEIPLTAGVAVGGVITIIARPESHASSWSPLGALAALIAHLKVQIIRTDDTPDA